MHTTTRTVALGIDANGNHLAFGERSLHLSSTPAKNAYSTAIIADFGNPATSLRSVALRPRLATGLPFSVTTEYTDGSRQSGTVYGEAATTVGALLVCSS